MPDVAACPDAETLVAFAHGRTTEETARAVEAHLSTCPDCVAALTAERSDPLLDAVRGADSSPGSWAVGDPRLASQPTPVVPAPRPDASTREFRPGPVAPPERTEAYSVPDAPPVRLLAGGQIGPYRVLGVLGQGGMGAVYRAEDPALGRPLALKVMLPHAAAAAGAKERFLREARAAAALKHDHVVTIYQVGEEAGAPFIAMELLAGEPLDAKLRRVGRLPAAEAARVGRQAAEGLAAAHAAGMVHRDVKPANLWLEGPTERVKVLDFGLVRGGAGGAEATSSGAIVGTPAYMAPEQARAGGKADPRADLFSLGCVLYRAVTGVNPFQGDDVISVLMAVATEKPAPPNRVDPAVPRVLSDFILALLEKDPARRPESATAVAARLRALEAALAAPPAPAKRKPPRGPLVALGLLGVGLAHFGGWVIVRDKEGNEIGRQKVPDGGKVEYVEDAPKPSPATGATKPPERPPLKLADFEVVGPSGWSEAGGVIRAEPKGNQSGWLATKRDYADVEVELEFRLPADGNSGVFLRAWNEGELSGKDFTEVQLYGDDSKLNPKNKTGAIWNLTEPKPAPAAPPNQWNRAKVRSVGKRVTVTINGVTCSDAEVPFTRPAGRVGLQRLRTPAEFRNVRVTDLGGVVQSIPGASAEPPPLAEWLRGRKHRTVAQDGSGEFRTIGAALDALKAGEVVKVLDAGPYREALRPAGSLPAGCGLVSEAGTRIEPPDVPATWHREAEWDRSLAHHLHAAGDFRISGFHFATPPREDGQAMRVVARGSFVLEGCRVAHAATEHVNNRAVALYSELADAGAEVVVRDCWIDGRMTVDAHRSGPPTAAALTRCYVTAESPRYTAVQFAGLFRRIDVAANVFAASSSDLALFQVTGDPEVAVRRNTFRSPGGVRFGEQVPATGVRLEENLLAPGQFRFVAGLRPAAADGWAVGRNRRGAAPPDEYEVLPAAKTDATAPVTFLSGDPVGRDYLRVPATDPPAGALPAGPAPPGGDWFSRLREKWSERKAAEPPPLTEWLKRRKERTVAQDGRGEFRTIQAALTAARSGEVVRVLDAGPYRESLKLERPPADVSLVSDAKTVILVDDWHTQRGASADGRFAHRFLSARDFRVAGFAFRYKAPPGATGRCVSFSNCRGVVFEGCAVLREAGPDPAGHGLAFDWWDDGEGDAGAATVRDCVLHGYTFLQSAAMRPEVLVTRCHFADKSLTANGSFGRLVVERDVFDAQWSGLQFVNVSTDPGGLRLARNTVPRYAGNQFQRTAPDGAAVLDNIFLRATLFQHGAEGDALAAARRNWDVRGNCYAQPPESDQRRDVQLYRRPGDRAAGPAYLSDDPASRDYLRVAAGGPLDGCGALDAGPAPEGGDWFTRLREKWGEGK